ncbi:MAG: hypothetical protein EOP61_15890 [Sphingomonadales bacterium]|nr:MAG: hypothetical protein EOP61_15890 [Sphingomonadales bacterium]
MGLFSNLMGRGLDAEVDKSTAVMIPMVAAMAADGNIDDDEIAQIRSICVWSPIYATNSRDQDTQIILRALRLVGDHGAEAACTKAAEVLSPALRETSFCFAARIVFADEHVGLREQKFLEDLIPLLGLDAGRARQIVEVVSIMQHPLNA